LIIIIISHINLLPKEWNLFVTCINEYRIQLQRAVEALDAAKAKSLADLERDLQEKQQLIMNEAKKQSDLLKDQANAAK